MPRVRGRRVRHGKCWQKAGRGTRGKRNLYVGGKNWAGLGSVGALVVDRISTCLACQSPGTLTDILQKQLC